MRNERRCDDRRLELVREVYINITPPEDELKKLLVETVAASWRDYREDLTFESEIGMLMEEFPAFMKDVLGRLENGALPTPPHYIVQPKGVKRKEPDCE